MKINVFKILNKTSVEGPGQRFCLWVQGCSRHCSGCFAKSTWSHNPNKLIDVTDVFEMIKHQKDIEGVTFLGGEPFEQAKALCELAALVKKQGLSVMTFTGGNYDELKNSPDEHVIELLNNTDLLVDGEFKQEEFDLTRPWVGSLNQRYIFLSDRYCQADISKYKNRLEMRIDKNGVIFVNGMADFANLKHSLCLQNS